MPEPAGETSLMLILTLVLVGSAVTLAHRNLQNVRTRR
jgi:hypothetical protein